jgi:hypothetical protein
MFHVEHVMFEELFHVLHGAGKMFYVEHVRNKKIRYNRCKKEVTK